MFKIHPIYRNYGYNLDTNEIVHIPTNKNIKQRPCSSEYLQFMASDGSTQKTMFCHRFIWECCSDVIPKGYEIDHIDKDKTNNKITNLRCITISENRRNRDHTNIVNMAKNAHKLKRFIKAINVNTNEFNCFKSKSQCGKYLNTSPAMIYLICAKKGLYRHANTIKGKYKFEYIDEKDVENLINIPHGKLGKTYNKIKV